MGAGERGGGTSMQINKYLSESKTSAAIGNKHTKSYSYTEHVPSDAQSPSHIPCLDTRSGILVYLRERSNTVGTWNKLAAEPFSLTLEWHEWLRDDRRAGQAIGDLCEQRERSITFRSPTRRQPDGSGYVMASDACACRHPKSTAWLFPSCVSVHAGMAGCRKEKV